MRIRAKFVRINASSTSSVAERWHHAYFKAYGDKWRPAPFACGKTAEQIYTELCSLGENPDRDAVAKVIGNQSWSYLMCDGCSEYVAKTVAIGEYEAKQYCRTCLQEALQILNEET